MPEQTCPCCQWTVVVPEEAGDAIVACSECGQVLQVPPPWKSADIQSCDTRPLIDYPDDMEAGPPDPDAPRVPWVLTVRTPKSARGELQNNTWFGVASLILGVLLATYGVNRGVREGWSNDWVNPASVLGGAFFLMGGAVLVRLGLRRSARRTRARVLRVSEALPAEAQQLGTPFALHQVAMFWRLLIAITGGFLMGIGAIILAELLKGNQLGGKAMFAAAAGLIGGPLLIWRGLIRQNVGVLVFPEGFVNLGGRRADIWRWDHIESIWLKFDEQNEPATNLSCTVARKDGERFTFSADIEFLENQFVARLQHEVCRRLLPQVRSQLEAGNTLTFGPLQIDREGVQGKQFVAWPDIDDIVLDPPNLVIHSPAGPRVKAEATAITNLAVIWMLMRELHHSG